VICEETETGDITVALVSWSYGRKEGRRSGVGSRIAMAEGEGEGEGVRTMSRIRYA
jgi:hypothetical protein